MLLVKLFEEKEVSMEFWESPSVSKKEVLFLTFFFRLFLVLEVVACMASFVDNFSKLEGAELLTTAGFKFRWLPQTPDERSPEAAAAEEKVFKFDNTLGPFRCLPADGGLLGGSELDGEMLEISLQGPDTGGTSPCDK